MAGKRTRRIYKRKTSKNFRAGNTRIRRRRRVKRTHRRR